MTTAFFEGIESIPFEGPESNNPLAFRYYDEAREVMGKSMAEHLRPAVCYWHTFCGDGTDMFGSGTLKRPWFEGDNPMVLAEHKAEVAFEFLEKLGTPFFCFHDRDIAPEGASLAESNGYVSRMAETIAGHMERTGVKLLWGTANLFTHPRFMSGAATNPDPDVFAYAAAQVKHCLETTQQLGGVNYVLWGGREGYETLLNTDMKHEMEQLGRFMQLVVEHKHKIGFKGTLLIEPKPCEPTKHQYDFDSAAVYAFLQKFDLADEMRVNVEVNHATLAGHTFQHELAYSVANGILGSVDINRGDTLLGWDTDQFPNSVEETTLAVYTILQGGGLTTGGFNFDAKIRRQSVDPADLFHAHIGGLDTLARGLLNASKMLEDRALANFVDERYAGWQSEPGAAALAGGSSLEELSSYALESGIDPQPRSGRQEMLENIVNRYL